MEREGAGEGEAVGGPDASALLADRHADDVAGLHRVASLAPGDPDERLVLLLEAGCRALGATTGLVLLRTGAELHVRVAAGEGDVPPPGAAVVDRRVDDVLDRQATVATLGGPSAGAVVDGLGPGPLIACPLWITGRVAGAIAFVAEGDVDPFSAWQLALVDLVADGASRVLEREADIRALVQLESQSQAMIAVIPDPLVRLGPDGQVLDDADRPIGPFDPVAAVRPPGLPVDPDTEQRVRTAVAEALASGELRSEVFVTGVGPLAHHVEARFVPAAADQVLCIVRDVTEQRRAEAALAEQVAFEALVTSISTRLISCAPLLLDDAIEIGLGEIAAFFQADSAFIDELSADGSVLRVAHQWTRRNQPASRRRGDQVAVAGFGWLTARFERNGHVFARGRGALPPEATEQALVDPDDRGVLWVRLGYGGELVGLLGLTWKTHEPPESDEVLGLVRFAADAFLGAMRRRSVALLADGQAAVFELIARGAPVDTALLAARDLLARHTLGATVVVVTVDEAHRLQLVVDPDDPEGGAWASWFAAREVDLGNPFGQAVVTGEPVMVADARGDPRFGIDALPDARFRAGAVLPVRSPRNGRTLALVVLLATEPGAPVARPSVRDSVVSLVTVALERSIDERRLAHQATHDPLTGAGNRAALLDRLTLALARAKRTGREVGVLFCDLDGFKAVNDRFGHDRGDRLLVEVAERIGRAVRPSDTVCRTGGDEFVVVCEDLADRDQIHAISARVRQSIEASPIDIGEARLPVTASVGVAVADLPVDDPDRLLRTADLAMYASKQRRAAQRAAATDIDLTDRAIGAAEGADHRAEPLGPDLLEALDAGSLQLAHQPLVGRDGSLAGVEVLLRWQHPSLGEVGPERILAAAANDDLTIRLGRWVRRTGLAHRRRWKSAQTGPGVVPVHVNVEGIELASPHFVDTVLADLDEAGVGPEALVLEVRERHLADGTPRAVVQRLAGEGIAVLVEGAGQGGLPLAELAELQVCGLKVSRSLVARIREDDPLGVEVARSLVLLAHGLGWRSLAVGVETDHQRAVLFGFGVDAVQGRAVTMPVTADQLVSWLAARAGG